MNLHDTPSIKLNVIAWEERLYRFSVSEVRRPDQTHTPVHSMELFSNYDGSRWIRRAGGLRQEIQR